MDILRAMELLKEEDVTCVFVGNGEEIICRQKGIMPILTLISEKRNLKGFCVADKIVGRAAAMLFAFVGIREIYAELLSQSGREILDENGIRYSYGELCEYILNRTASGLCPLEEAVRDLKDVTLAHDVLTKRLAALKAKS